MSKKCDYVDLFNKEMRLINYRPSTIGCYTSILKAFLQEFRSPERASSIEIKNYILNKNNTNTKRQLVGALKLFYSRILNQSGKIQKIPYPKKEKTIPEILTPNEVSKIIQNTNNLKHKAILLLAYSGALRVGEIPMIKISDISKDGLLKISQGKGAKDRIIPIPEGTIEILREYFIQYKPKMYLFEGQNDFYSTSSIQKVLFRAKEKSGISKHITVHTLRHSRATHLLDNGLDLFNVKEILGHSSVKTTMIYLHTAKNNLKRMIEMTELKIIQNSAA